MKKFINAIAIFFSSAALFLASAAQAQPAAQNFPVRPIHLVVPFSAGGATDIIARQIGADMAKTLGQPVVIDNQTGASGAIGTEAVARAAADGYTLLLGVTTTHGINPALNPKLRYNPVSDFTPISLVATMPHMLVVGKSSPIRSLSDFVRAAKAAQPSFAYGSRGTGSPPHPGGGIVKNLLGFDAIHVPYRGGAPALVGLMGGEIQFMSTGVSEASSMIASGEVRALAVASQRRLDGLDVPTFAELGHPFELTAWYALFAPANLPRDVLARLSEAVVKATRSPDVQNSFAKLSVTPVGSTPEELAKLVASETRRWAAAVKAAGITPQ